MQILWLIFIYFVAGLTGNTFQRKMSSQKKNNLLGRFKSVLAPFFIGLGGVLTADLLSEGNPLWPALGLVSGMAGVLYPLWRQSEQGPEVGLAVYFGGVFYLKPVIALTGIGFALEVLLLSKDWVLTVSLFCGILPVLFSFSQVNPLFFWAAVVIQLIFLFKFKNEIQSRIKGFFNPN